jgi:hypothetical protein
VKTGQPIERAWGGETIMTSSRILVLALAMLGLTACGGGGAEVSSTVEGATLGQQLEDLQKAHANGLLTDDEYEDAREAIMDRYDD